MRKKEVVEDKIKVPLIRIMKIKNALCPFAATIPYTYIYHMYIWVNLLGTEVIISHTRELTLYSFILLVWNI